MPAVLGGEEGGLGEKVAKGTLFERLAVSGKLPLTRDRIQGSVVGAEIVRFQFHSTFPMDTQ